MKGSRKDKRLAPYFPKASVRKVWEEKFAESKNLAEGIPFRNLVVVSIFINIFLIAVVLLAQNWLPPQIPLFYGKPEGEEQLASSLALTLPSAASLLILLVNTSLAIISKEEFLKRTLVLAGIAATLFSVITTIKIIVLVGSF